MQSCRMGRRQVGPSVICYLSVTDKFEFTVPIVALETMGSDCFYHSMSLNKGRFNAEEKKLPPTVDLVYDEANDVYLAHFNRFDSKASGSLGASEPAPAVVRMALDWPGGVRCVSVPDAISMETLALFASKSDVYFHEVGLLMRPQ